MPSTFPEYVALKSLYNGKYMEYVELEEEGQMVGHCRASGEDVVSPLCKFRVQLADGNPQLVHLFCCYNNKYLSAASLFNRYIVCQADEPNPDENDWSCTLFRPARVVSRPGEYFLMHVNTGNFTALSLTFSTDPKNNCLITNRRHEHPQHIDIFTMVDWNSLVILPQHVAFRLDTGDYLSARVIERQNYLMFATPDSGDQTVGHEVFRNLDGSIRLKSNFFGRFWKRSPNWIWADSNDTTSNNRDTVFWPQKVNDTTIALRNLGNDRFCGSLTTEGKTSCLNAFSTTISNECRLEVSELVLNRDIYNVEFHLNRARRYNEQVVSMGSGEAANTTNHEGSLDVGLTRTETTSTSWSSSISVKVGVATKLVTKIPVIAEGHIEISTEVSSTHQWGEVEEVTNSIEVIYRALVPPMTRVTVSAIGSTATCDVPFSYTQTDTYVDGRRRTFRMDDGLYTGINSFNVSYHVSSQDLIVG